MTISRSSCNPPFLLSAVSLLLVVSATPLRASDPDPTTPSPLLTRRLTAEDGVQQPQRPVAASTESDCTLEFQLKGIVLRDRDHGTALIALGRAEAFMVTLRRGDQDTSPDLWTIGGCRLAVEDFSDSGVVMRNVDTGERFFATRRIGKTSPR